MKNSNSKMNSLDGNRTIYVIRHGETDYNKKHLMQGRSIDAPLNETGQKQAKAIADYLDNNSIDRVVCSSMRRTLQTAQPLINGDDIDLISHGDLDEMDFGKFEGKNYLDFKEEITAVHNKWVGGDTSYPMPGGESPEEVWQRAGNRAEQYLQSFEDENIAFIIHGRVIRILLSVWTGLGLKNMHKIDHANGAINCLRYSSSGFDVLYLNRISHLPVSYSLET